MLLLLILGFIKVAMLTVGLYFSVQLRRLVATLAFAVSMVNAGVFSFRNAGYHVPANIVTIATVVTAPGVALLVGAILLEYRRWS